MAGLLRISEAFSLAFHSLAHLVSAQEARPVSAAELARTFEVSEAHLAKVLQRLARVGILNSKRGPRGGFTLACEPEDVTLLQIHEAVDGPLDTATCLLGEHKCPENTCVMEELLHKVYDDVHEHLSTTTLSDLIRAGADDDDDIQTAAGS